MASFGGQTFELPPKEIDLGSPASKAGTLPKELSRPVKSWQCENAENVIKCKQVTKRKNTFAQVNYFRKCTNLLIPILLLI